VHPTGIGYQPEDSESILDCREFSFESLRSMVAEGEIQDANTLALFARLAAKRLIP